MSLKRVYPDKMVKPPITPRGGCVPYVIACLLNKEKIIDQYPNEDKEGKPVSYDFYHASMMFGANMDKFSYFEALLAKSRVYGKDGKMKPPKKFVEFLEFSHCATIMFVSKTYQKKSDSKIILLLETTFRKKVHAVGVVLDVRTGKAIVIDVLKDKILTMDIGKVFKMYNVLKIAILKYSPVQIPVFEDAFFVHLLESGEDGGVSDN